ncbi:MAG: hypothetical protein OXI24_18490 [Candidatus Poribacteria bacterium]|nr:hypothetical protein [Candidatus Poribacteria bacterium]
MRFIIISLLCLSILIIGCLQGKIKNSGQAETSPDNISNAIQTREAAANAEISDAEKHYNAFASLSKTDTDAAIRELSKYADLRFKGHPLAEKWLKLVHRLAAEKKGTFRDMERYTEWYLQMLTDIDPEKRIEHDVKTIKNLQNGLKQLEIIGRMLERQGKDLETYEMPGTFF